MVDDSPNLLIDIAKREFRDEIMWRQGWISAIEDVAIHIKNTGGFNGVMSSRLLNDLLEEMLKNDESIYKEKRKLLKKKLDPL